MLIAVIAFAAAASGACVGTFCGIYMGVQIVLPAFKSLLEEDTKRFTDALESLGPQRNAEKP